MPFCKTRARRPDGRYLWYYAWDGPTPPTDAPARPAELYLCRAADGLRVRVPEAS
ncbi:MAG: hypothetical protein HY723_01805 [Chloroflexi bacterium]|nr:hypothetical protein [Chloroflexota bacterium]